MYLHYKALNDAADIPILIYNIPGRTGVNMTVETMARLARLPNIAGVKDAANDITRTSLQRWRLVLILSSFPVMTEMRWGRRRMAGMAAFL